MLNKLGAFIDSYAMLAPGDEVVCAVSGGADSMALLWAMYLLKDKRQIKLSAAHFNHCLRGEESDRDEAFVKSFCEGYGIPLIVGRGNVVAGKKGLEAAAREARYAFLHSLPGKIATAHTADDNAETLIMHMVRGTGLKGLGGIAPVNGALIRPMLSVTRQDVEGFLESYSVPYVDDSSNASDEFLRNRVRHHVMPVLRQENPCFAQNLSQMALRLRQDEAALETVATEKKTDDVSTLRQLEPGIRSRILRNLLLDAGVKEPEAAHIKSVEKLVFSSQPSARIALPGGITVARNYDCLEICEWQQTIETRNLACPGVNRFPELGIQVICSEQRPEAATDWICAKPAGNLVLRSRMEGDSIRLPGGTKSLKKLFIDRKIPAGRRNAIPIVADEAGVLLVGGVDKNLDRVSAQTDAMYICIEYL